MIWYGMLLVTAYYCQFACIKLCCVASFFAALFLEQDCYTRHVKRTDLICWMNKQLLVCVCYPPIIGDTTRGSCSHNADQTTLVKARLPATYYSFHTWHFKNNNNKNILVLWEGKSQFRFVKQIRLLRMKRALNYDEFF